MLVRFAVVTAALVSLCGIVPAAADEVGVGVGPVGVTVGSGPPVRERDKTVIIKKERPEVDRKTVIIKKDRPVERDRAVVIDHN